MDSDRTRSSQSEQPNECNVWQSLVWKIEELFPVDDGRLFPDAPPKAKWAVGGSVLNFGIDLLRAEKPFRTDIEMAIRALCAGRSIPLSDEVRYFLAVRGRVVRWFLLSLEIDEHGPGHRNVSQTIIPFPEGLASSEIIRWLMFDWWNSNGAKIATLLRLQEMHTEPGKPG